MWFWIWRSVVLVGCVMATVLVGKWVGDPWNVYLPLVVSLLVLPPVVQRWRRLSQTHRGTRGSGQDVTD